MASGMGLHGTVSRCFFHYRDFAECMKTSDEPIRECTILRDDYFECLHGRREIARKKAIASEIERQTKLGIDGKEPIVGGLQGGGSHH